MKFDFAAIYGGPSNGTTVLTDGAASKQKPNTPKVGLEYRTSENVLLYASAAKGFRQGGAQSKKASVCDADLAALGYSDSPTSYDSDEVWSYELGLKGTFLDGRLRLNTSAFQVNWTNIQSPVRLVLCSNSIIINLGEAQSKGFDLEAEYKVSDSLSLGASLGYADAVYTETVEGSEGANGTRPILVADGDAIGSDARPWRIAFSATTDFTMFNRDAFFLTDYTFQDKADPSSVNNPNAAGYDGALFPRKANNLLNMRLGIRAREGLEVSIFAKNLLNEAPLMNRSHVGGSSLYTIDTIRPRSYGATVSYRF